MERHQGRHLISTFDLHVHTSACKKETNKKRCGLKFWSDHHIVAGHSGWINFPGLFASVLKMEMLLLWPCMRINKKGIMKPYRCEAGLWTYPASFPVCPFDGIVLETEIDKHTVHVLLNAQPSWGAVGTWAAFRWFQRLIGYHALFVIFSSSLWTWNSSKVTMGSQEKIGTFRISTVTMFSPSLMKGAFFWRVEVRLPPHPSSQLHSS